MRVVHILAAVWVLAVAVAAWRAPDAYAGAMQEDRAVEWWTVGAFFLAGLTRLRAARGERRAFDALVAIFCLFVAGEEMSWGQRLVGYTPTALFLAHNAQQELTLHNLEVFGRPKWGLIAALFGYGVLLPLVGLLAARARSAAGRLAAQSLRRLGVSTPPLAVVPRLGACVGLLMWYPLEFTGEWVEALAGGLFLTTSTFRPRALARAGVAAVAFGATMTLVSARAVSPGAEVVRVTCARAEAAALIRDLGEGAALADLVEVGSVHKRVWTAAADGYLDWARVRAFRVVPCHGTGNGPGSVARRRAYAVDPWGTAYWLRTWPDPHLSGDARRVTVYSFGPNRRRDAERRDDGGLVPRGDDVLVAGTIHAGRTVDR